jgi:hypothetical protein
LDGSISLLGRPAICRTVTNSVAAFLGEAIPRDDLTLVVANFV